MIGGAFRLARPALGLIDAETAHAAAIAALRLMPRGTPAPDDPRLATTAFGLRFPNPVGLAAGFDKNAEVPDALLRLGFGFVEVGGVTPQPQPGNDRPRVFRLPADEAVINRYGLNSAGLTVVAERLAARSRIGLVGVNLAPNKDSRDRIADYLALAGRLMPAADYLSLNVSSPNTPGLRDLQAREALNELLARIIDLRAAADLRTPILLKIAPDVDDLALDDVSAAALDHRIDGLIVANTTTTRPPGLRERRLAQEAGGLSGRPLFARSTSVLARAYLRLGDRMPLIGVGGIDSGAAALVKIAAGASLLQLYTGLVYRGPALIGEIKSALLAELSARRLGSLSTLVGSRAAELADTIAGNR